MIHPKVNCFKLLRHLIPCACCLDLANAGSNNAAKIAIMAITTSNSIRVNALRPAFLRLGPRLPVEPVRFIVLITAPTFPGPGSVFISKTYQYRAPGTIPESGDWRNLPPETRRARRRQCLAAFRSLGRPDSGKTCANPRFRGLCRAFGFDKTFA